MKKSCLVLLGLIAFVLRLQAQVFEVEPTFRYGVYGGYVSSFLDGGNTVYSAYKKTPNYHFGALLQYDFNESVGVQSGLNLIRKGAQSYTTRWDTTITLSYLQLPLTLMFGITSNIYIRAGLYSAILFGANKSRLDTYYNKNDPTTFKDPIVEDVSSQFKSMDYGYIFGLQGQFQFLIWNVSYESGRNIAQNANLSESIRNFAICFSVGVLFPSKKVLTLLDRVDAWECPN